jgi:hypothetical protein
MRRYRGTGFASAERRELASLFDSRWQSATSAQKGAPGTARVPARPPLPALPPRQKRLSAFGVYARPLCRHGMAAMMIWPYPSKCGLGLIGYLAANGVVVAGGRAGLDVAARAARAHTVSLVLVGAGAGASRCCRERLR